MLGAGGRGARAAAPVLRGRARALYPHHEAARRRRGRSKGRRGLGRRGRRGRRHGGEPHATRAPSNPTPNPEPRSGESVAQDSPSLAARESTQEHAREMTCTWTAPVNRKPVFLLNVLGRYLLACRWRRARRRASRRPAGGRRRGGGSSCRRARRLRCCGSLSAMPARGAPPPPAASSWCVLARGHARSHTHTHTHTHTHWIRSREPCLKARGEQVMLPYNFGRLRELIDQQLREASSAKPRSPTSQ